MQKARIAQPPCLEKQLRIEQRTNPPSYSYFPSSRSIALPLIVLIVSTLAHRHHPTNDNPIVCLLNARPNVQAPAKPMRTSLMITSNIVVFIFIVDNIVIIAIVDRSVSVVPSLPDQHHYDQKGGKCEGNLRYKEPPRASSFGLPLRLPLGKTSLTHRAATN